MKRVVIIPGILILAAAGIILYYSYNPESNILFPKCTFFSATGLKCPGCGTQRAIHALLNGEFSNAFKYNAILISGIPVAIVLLYAEIIRTKRTDIYTKINSKHIVTGIGVIMVSWWIIRNIFNW